MNAYIIEKRKERAHATKDKGVKKYFSIYAILI